MLNFTRTTIINSKDSYQVVEGLVKADGSKGSKLAIKFGDTLYSDDEHVIKVVGYQPYSDAKFAEANVDLAGLNAKDLYRICIYVRIQNNNASTYSNKWTFKGRPFVIEFKGSMSAAEVAKLVKKYCLVQFGSDLLKITANGNKLNIKAKDQWQKFFDQDYNDGVVLQKLETGVVLGTNVIQEHWETIPGAEVIEKGTEAFGDFQHIVKDLRLPTAANLAWHGIAQGDVYGGEPNDDKPIPYGKYHQFSVQYDSERGIQMQTAVGGLGRSRTMHIFYVEDAVVEDFMDNLALVAANPTVLVKDQKLEDMSEQILTEANRSELSK